MRKIHWGLIGLVGLSVSIFLYLDFAPERPQKNLTAAQPDVRLPPAENGGSLWIDGIAQYRAKMAIAASSSDEENPLRSYQPTPGIAGRIALEEITGKGIPATPLSARLALGLVRGGQLSVDEKIAMPSLLGRLYNRENTSGANQDIALELKMLADDPDQQVAANAAMYYARLEYQPDTDHVLKQALERGALDTESYFREMAHLVTSAPAEKQKEFLAEIRASANPLASSILATALNSGQDYNAAPFLKSSEDMEKLLRETEPRFDEVVSRYGGVDALRYIDWIRASATIESAKTGRSVDDIIVAKLSEPDTDARKVLAYLSSWNAAPLLEAAASGSQVQKLAAIARRPSDQNPGNAYMRFLAETIESRMNNPPPAAPQPVFAMPPESAAGPVPGPNADKRP